MASQAIPFAPGATRPMVQRAANARADFVAMLQLDYYGAFSASEARSILDFYLAQRLARIDHGIGRVNVRSGNLLEVETLREALAMAEEA